ncbi:unnamed protein product [Lota lota]
MKRSTCLLLVTLVPLWVSSSTTDQSHGIETAHGSSRTLEHKGTDLIQLSRDAHNGTNTAVAAAAAATNTTAATAAAATTTTTAAATTTTTAATVAALESCMFGQKQGRVLLMVVGTLIVACVGLLVTTALLVWKICQRRPDADGDSDLISNSQFWMGSAQRNKAQRKQQPAAGESCLLLGHLEIKEEQGAGGGGGGEGAEGAEGTEGAEEKEKEAKGGEEEVEAGGGAGSDPDTRANGTDGVPAEAGPAADPCREEGSRGPEDAV